MDAFLNFLDALSDALAAFVARYRQGAESADADLGTTRRKAA